MPQDSLLQQVGDLLKRFGAVRHVDAVTTLDGLTAGTAAVDSESAIAFDVQLERIAEGIVVRGSVDTEWHAECSRCLAPTSARMQVGIDELFEPEPVLGETYLLDGEILDLEPMIRDAIVLELPQAPTCRVDCAGLCPSCGVDRNEATCECTTDVTDPRWAALSALDQDK